MPIISDDTVTVNKTGNLSAARDAGIPEQLLIPVRPWNCPDEDGKNAGKAPACPNDYGGWFGLSNWQNADTEWNPVKALADRCGANAGLILGTMVDRLAFAFLDFDLDEGQQTHRDRLLNSYALTHKRLLVRETVPHRAGVLVRLGSMTDMGNKAVYHLSYKDDKIGKIELLTVRQQAVIAGTHHSGNPITWSRYGDADGAATCAPAIGDDMLTFDTFIQCDEDFREWMQGLTKLGYRFECESASRGEGHDDDRDLAPEWLTVDKLINIIRATPNTESVDRQAYVQFMHAVGASMWGIIAWHGELAPSQRAALDECVADWACHWPLHGISPVKAYSAELHKWLTDWSKRKVFATSWQRLVGLASRFGNREAAAINAQYDFAGMAEEPPAGAGHNGGPHLEPQNEDMSPFAGKVPNSDTSDFTISDYIRCTRGLDQQYAFLPSLGQWVRWDKRFCASGGWSVDPTGSYLSCHIQFELQRYAYKFGSGAAEGEGWNADKINSVTSQTRLARVRDNMKMHLTRDIDPDADPWLLGTATGVLNLQSGDTIAEVGEAKRSFVTKYTSVPVGDVTKCPEWLRFLHSITGGTKADALPDGPDKDTALRRSQELTGFLGRVCGYCLSGSVKEEVSFFFYGTGQNGKSTFVRVLMDVLADYADTIRSHVLMQTHHVPHSTWLAKLRGLRLVTASEIAQGQKWDIETLKLLSGQDAVTANFMHQNETTYTPQFKLIISGNHKPTIGHIDKGLERRMVLVPFTVTIPESERDKDLKDKLRAEYPHILAWMVAQCREWQQCGLQVPACVKDATNDYLAEQEASGIGKWIRRRCIVDERCSAGATELYNDFIAWAKDIERDEAEEGKAIPGVAKLSDMKQAAFGNELARISH